MIHSDGTYKNMVLGIYQLAPVPKVDLQLIARANALDLNANAGIKSDLKSDFVSTGSLKLSINRSSGSERLVDTSRFFREESVTPDKLLTNSAYLKKARSYVAATFPNMDIEHLYPYKLWKYVGMTSGPQGRSAKRVQQIAIAFNTEVDGLPVIGPGAKIAVHMDTSARVVSYESSIRKLAERLAILRGDQLLSPIEARRMVENRLNSRGVHLSDYALSRTEFGYFRLGRSSVQRYLAPHYAFFYRPLPGAIGKRLVEVEPAVADPDIRQLLSDDKKAEAQRKLQLYGEASPSDTHP